MDKLTAAILGNILIKSFLAFVGIGCVFSLLFGIGMVVWPRIVLDLNEYASKWISNAKFIHPLDRIFRIERFVYRNHRAVGALVVLAAQYILYVFLFNFDQGATLKSWSSVMPRIVAEWLIEAMIFTLALSSVFAAMVGVVLFARPSLMRGFESAANRWWATDETLMRLEVMRDFPDRFIARHVRGAGVAVVVASLYALSVFGIALFAGK